MNENTLDWFAGVILNPDLDYAHYNAQGFDDTNTIMRTPDQYKKMDRVQKIFTDKDGKFNDSLFNQKYNEALKTFNTFISGDIQDKYFRQYTGTIYNPSAEKVVVPSLRITMVDNPLDVSYGLTGFNKESKPLESTREIAQRSKVYDSESKQVLDYTPNDFFASMTGASLIEAKWDKAGTHVDSWGNEVFHQKGDWKTYEGKPYYETLGSQDSTGKNFLHWTDVTSDDGSFMNSIDFLDNDGLEKSITGQTLKTIASVGMLFVPYVSTGLLVFGIAKGLSDIYSTFTKSIEEASNGKQPNKSDAWKFANSMDGWFSRFDRSQSDESLEKAWGYENITNIVYDFFEQLKQQKAIAKGFAKLPKLFGQSEEKVAKVFIEKNKDLELGKYGKTLEQAVKDKDIGTTFKDLDAIFGNNAEFTALKKVTIGASKLGQELGSDYMALIQVKDVYENLKQNNFDSSTVLAGTVAASLGFMGIMKTELGKVAYSAFKPNEVQKVLSPIITDAIRETAEASGAKLGKQMVTDAGKMKFIKNAYNNVMGVAQSLWDTHGEYGIKGYLGDMLKEGTEEVSEELLQDIIMQGAKYYEEGIKSLPGYKSKNTYQYSESSPFDRYAMSFFGGALGGGIFKASEHIENYSTIRDAKSSEAIPKDTMTKLVSTLVTFDLAKVENEINKQLDKGLLSDKLSTEVTEESKSDKDLIFKVADDSSKSQREVVRSNLLGFIRGVDAYLKKENLKLDKKDVVNMALVRPILAQGLSNNFTNLIYTEYLTEAAAKTKLALQLNGMENESEKGKIKAQIDIHTKNIENILTGANAGEYAEKIAFVNNKQLLDLFISPSVQIYAKSQYGKNYNGLSDSKKAIVDESYKQYLSRVKEDRDVVKAYKMFKMFKETFQTDIAEFKDSGFLETYKNVQDILLPKEVELSDEDMQEKMDLVREGMSDDEFIKQYNLNEVGNKLTDEQKKNLVDSTLKNYINNNPRIANINTHDTDPYNTLLGSNYVLDPFNKQRTSEIIDGLHEFVTNGGKLPKYTRDMLQSYLASVNNDLDTNKTLTKSIREAINTEFEPENDSNGVPLNENRIFDIWSDINAVNKKDPFSTIALLAFGDSQITNVDPNLLNSNNTHMSTFADSVKEGLENQINLEKNGLGEGIENSYKDTLIEVRELKALKNKLDVILNKQESEIKDPIYDMLSKISTELFGKDLFSLLKEEDRNFKSAGLLDNYVIRDVFSHEELEGMLDVIRIFKTITTATSSNSDYMNVINAYRKQHDSEPYVEFDDAQSSILNNVLEDILMQVNFLLNISDKNYEGKIPTEKKTWFETQKHLLLSLRDFVNENNISELNELLTLSVLEGRNYDESTAEEDITFVNDALKNAEKVMYKWFDTVIDESVLFGEDGLFKLKNDSTLNDNIKLVKNPNDIEYSDLLFKQWLLYMSILNPEDFNNRYQKFLQRSEISAPFYAQMLDVKIASAFMADEKGYFNKFGNLNSLKDQPYAEDLIFVDAPAGSGKTTMIAPFIWDMAEQMGKLCWAVSNSEENVKNLIKNIPDVAPEHTKTKDDLFKSILGDDYDIYTEIQNYVAENIKIGSTSEFKNKREVLINKISKTKKREIPEFILYDEAGHISAFERDIIQHLGIKMMAMGDLTQDTYMVKGENYDIDTNKQLFKLPKLPSGIRFNNVNMRLATLTLLELSEELNELLDKNGDTNSVVASKLARLKELVANKGFKYFQQEDDLLGIKTVEKEDAILNNKLTPEYESLVKNLINSGKEITYISDKLNENLALEEYLQDLGVNLISSDKIQGEQYEYTMINVQFDPNAQEKSSYIANFSKFNTLATRTINGSIMINNSLPIDNSSRVSTQPIDISMTEEEMANYKSLWLSSYFNDAKTTEESEAFKSASKISPVEEVEIETFKKIGEKINVKSLERSSKIKETELQAKGKTDLKSYEQHVAEVLDEEGGYVILNTIFDTLFPYNKDKSVNWQYWMLNLMFFNNSDEWVSLINNRATDDVRNAIKDVVNIDKLQDAKVHFLPSGEIQLEYLDNNNAPAFITLQQLSIPFEHSTMLFKDLTIESNKVTFDKEAPKVRRSSKEFENSANNKVKVSNTLYAGHINNNEAIYAFATYNLWSNNDKLGELYANDLSSAASPVAVNPIGRTFQKFEEEWKNSHSAAVIDALAGMNQSYRLIKSLVDYANLKNFTNENDYDDYKLALDAFLTDLKLDVELGLDLTITTNNGTIEINKDSEKVLTNIFNGQSKISALAKKSDLFTKGITPYLKSKELTFDQIKLLFNTIDTILKGSDENKEVLDSLVNNFKDSEEIVNQLNILLSVSDLDNSTMVTDARSIISNVTEGIKLLTENSKEDFAKYFKTDLYFSMYRNLRMMNSIIRNLNKTRDSSSEKIYNVLYDTLNIITDSTKNGGEGLFKDGIWYNYVALKPGAGVEQTKKSENLYSSYKDLTSVYFDNEIKPPVVYFKLEPKQLSSNKVDETQKVKKITVKELADSAALNFENVTNLTDKDLLSFVGMEWNDEDFNTNRNLYDFLTSKIMKNDKELVTLQSTEDDKFKLSKDLTQIINEFEKTHSNTFLGEDGILRSNGVAYKFTDNGFVEVTEYVKGIINSSLNVNEVDMNKIDDILKDWDLYKEFVPDVEPIQFMESIRIILQSLSIDVKNEIKINLKEFRSKEYNIEGVDISDNQRAFISDIIDANDNYKCE